MIETVLVGTDGSDTAATAVARAIEVARGLGARLQIVSAYEPVPEGRLRQPAMPVPSDQAWAVNPRADVLALLASAERDARAAGVEQVETFARVGDGADAILDVAEEQRC